MHGDTVGLCRHCRHARRVPTAAAEYWLCGLSTSDPRFEKYPRLPVTRCAGHEEGEPRSPRDPLPE
jgi:hypothetical protein